MSNNYSYNPKFNSNDLGLSKKIGEIRIIEKVDHILLYHIILKCRDKGFLRVYYLYIYSCHRKFELSIFRGV